MTEFKTPWAEVVEFHGHSCGGLTLGFRAALLAMNKLGITRDIDEELILIAETDSCGVDAFQVLTGCTFGKGNLIFRDYGKHAFTLGRRSDGKAVRVVLNPDIPREIRGEVSDEELFRVSEVDLIMPDKATIFNSVKCAVCGEGVMEVRARVKNGQVVCIPCSEEYKR